MGYTHYWEPNQPVEEALWGVICEKIQQLCVVAKKQGYRLAGPLGTGEPEFDEDSIAFNGVGDDSYETFALERTNTRFNFCKTACRPYDAVVTAALCVVDTLTEGLYGVSSDGGTDNWRAGLLLAKQVLPNAEIPQGIHDLGR